MKTKKIDIRDVAALAGVSVGSASRVINNFENVTTSTRQKVERAIKALDYRPNVTAQSLRSRTSKTIGCMFTDASNPLYAAVFRFLEERFRRDGYMLLLANGLNDPLREIETIEMFSQRGMDGVIVAPGNEKHPALLKALDELPMPVVVLDRDIQCKHDALLFDHSKAIKYCVNHLIELGHTRIGLVLWKSDSRPVRRRIEGYKAAHRLAGLPLPGRVILAASATSSVFADIDALLKQRNPPTALIAQGTYTLNTTLQAIAANGLRIPQDISVVSIGDSDFAVNHQPPIAVLQADLSSVADMAAELIKSRITQPQLAARLQKIGFDFDLRESVGRPE